MRALNHIAGILLATVGTVFVLSSVALFYDEDRDVTSGMIGAMFVVLGLLPLGGAFVLLRATVTVPARACPQCGGREHKPAGVLRRSNNQWLLHLFGWLFASLWGASREKQVRCDHCETLYMTDTRGTRVAGVLLWVILLLVLWGAVAQLLER